MPTHSDPQVIRPLLELDRPWAAYALGDLAPGFREDAEWHTGTDPAVLLLYRGFDPPVLFTLGSPDCVRPLLDEVADEPSLTLSVRPEILPLVRERREVTSLTPMWRMVLGPDAPVPPADAAVRRLGEEDVPVLERLYQDGIESGEVPDAFEVGMVSQGVFFGAWEAGELVAAAGTHLVAPDESVGAVGNVYTRRDRRGRGLSTRVTAAVTAELVRQGVRTVVLNVSRENAAALRVYERLGYRRYCEFLEGSAALRS